MEALNRVLALRTEFRAVSRQTSSPRIRIAEQTGPSNRSLAESLLPGDRLSEAVRQEIRNAPLNGAERTFCLRYVHLEQVLEQMADEEQLLGNPYEPLILLLEQGGELSI